MCVCVYTQHTHTYSNFPPNLKENRIGKGNHNLEKRIDL